MAASYAIRPTMRLLFVRAVRLDPKIDSGDIQTIVSNLWLVHNSSEHTVGGGGMPRQPFPPPLQSASHRLRPTLRPVGAVVLDVRYSAHSRPTP